jgi:tetratricopeptide (TPR) repeat protein
VGNESRLYRGAAERGGATKQVERGLVLQRQGRHGDALAAFSRAAALRPRNAGLLGRVAATLAELGRHGEAVAAWEKVNRLSPMDVNAASGLALALMAAGRSADALAWLCGACDRHPRDASLFRLQARVLLTLGLRAQAIGALFMALELDPAVASTHAALAIALLQDGHAETALPYAHEALMREPAAPNAATLSCILIDLGRNEEALAVTSLDLPDAPGSVELFLNRSIALEGLGHGEEAITAARAALAAAPDRPAARHHLAATLLAAGELTPEAWALYEGRAGLAGAPTWPDPARRWRGQDLAGKTLLVHAEQGLGDTIQFVRYAPMLACRGARVILAVQPALVRLLRQTPAVDSIVAAGAALPEYDLYCPLLSLPGLLGTTLDTIPAVLPYALSPPTPARSGPLRVGLVWAGNPGFADDRKRSVDAALLGSLVAVQGARFYSLQFGHPGPLPDGITDLLAGVSDFADTAERIAELDLVIAVDTAVAHLAATMGKPVWLLSRFRGCWRWLQGRDDSPWYPSMRIFRQERPNDWPGVIDRVRKALAAQIEADQAAGRLSCNPERLQCATSSPR